MFATYIINEKNITIHYKLRIRGFYNLVTAYLLGIPIKISKKFYKIKLSYFKRIREFKYRKITEMMER